MGKFDKDLFGDLLNAAKGNRSINNYAQQSGVDSAHISRFIRGKVSNPPTPSTIERLANVAQNNISYQSLMIAAGHIDADHKHSPNKSTGDPSDYHEELKIKENQNKNYDADADTKEEKDIAKRMKQIREDLTHDDGLNFDGEPMSEEAIESLLDAMEYAVRQTQRINKKYIPKKYRNNKDNN
ncbi:DNA-binding protein [Lentibacillus sp. CBA3610]|uniref:DNA-binding protein n=1 Tax=Lentibacillus sp. CBA3610 TaxID=2518176 RepID=UPI001595E27E|nr:DNA-binding protein [Lentibacillus sp. CBA3610]QKY69441.1 DNA-binding protein [Lentibacillus sp. CBA3610]